MNQAEIDNLCINTIRMLSADAIEKAKSGHPGLPMGAAAFAYTLWTRHLRFNPKNPAWINRDRFVLSAGHGSMLLYSLLHLAGYDLPLDELKSFRQWGSKCPGHPEHDLTPGVETTTGPLGQGFANAVGMALAERFLADRYNKADHTIIDYNTYVIASDGDLMEGIAAEAASFAGGLKLGKLICLYDSNDISLDGPTSLSFKEDTKARFEAYNWHTLVVEDANDVEAVDAAITAAKQDERPSLLVMKTHIGFGSPNKHDTHKAHGAPLGEDELQKTKENLGWPAEPTFYIPEEAKSQFSKCIDQGEALEDSWTETYTKFQTTYPDLANELIETADDRLNSDWAIALPSYPPEKDPMATREASGETMNALATKFPLFLGGSADLGSSNLTSLKEFGEITSEAWEPGARNLHFGVREHAMGGILNGLALSRAITPFGATFLVFSDYMRASIRLAAIMKLRLVYVFTHDSIGQGEDGATHQPVEHLASLRAMPGLTVIRPSDATETVAAWRQAISNIDGPTALVLTRQKLPILDRSKFAPADGLKYGAYIIKDCQGIPDLLMIATGSEVPLALAATDILEQKGVKARVVSMPSTDLFEKQSDEYKARILPDTLPKRLIIEAGASFGWHKYAGPDGDILSIDQFGASAPGPVMMEKFGYTPENVVKRAQQLLKNS